MNAKEEALVEDVEQVLQELSGEEGLKMKPFNFKMDEVEGFRYRAREDRKSVV